MTEIGTADALEQVVGARPLASMMKTLDELDEHCVKLLSLSSLAVVGFADADGRARATTAGGAPGFVTVVDSRHLRFELDEPGAFDPRVGCCLLLFIPGLGETLRVNGRATCDGSSVVVTVDEAFAHCAKALLRSSFWSPPAASPAAEPLGGTASAAIDRPDVRTFLGQTPFLVLVSWDAQGRADASPKGDPVGFMRLADGRLAVPDRPGNRRTDTFHNVVEQPRVALLALVPGDDRVLEVSGVASLTTEPALLATMAVAGKTPKIALLLDAHDAGIRRSRALAVGMPWDPARRAAADQLPDMAGVFVDHVKRNERGGVAATAVRALASKRVMRWALANDYEKNRY